MFVYSRVGTFLHATRLKSEVYSRVFTFLVHIFVMIMVFICLMLTRIGKRISSAARLKNEDYTPVAYRTRQHIFLMIMVFIFIILNIMIIL